MTGLARWQLAVHYLGEALMAGGLAWGLYRMAVVHGCPTARFNDLSLIALGLGIAIAPLHPFGPAPVGAASSRPQEQRQDAAATAPAYLSPALRRNRNLAYGAWVLSLAGMVFAIFAMWFRLSNLVWFTAMIPAAYYMWFGIEVGRASGGRDSVGRDSVPADLGGRASLPAIESQGPGAKGQGEETGNREQGVGSTAVSTIDDSPVGPTAVSAGGAAHGPPAGRPWATPTKTGRTSAAPTSSPVGRTAVSAIDPDAGKMPALPGEEKSRAETPALPAPSDEEHCDA